MWPGGRDGIAMSDPPDGKFRILRTHDFGRTWSVVPDAGMPPAGTAELGFAAVGTSGSDVTYDGGRTWTAFGTDQVASTRSSACRAARAGPREPTDGWACSAGDPRRPMVLGPRSDGDSDRDFVIVEARNTEP